MDPTNPNQSFGSSATPPINQPTPLQSPAVASAVSQLSMQAEIIPPSTSQSQPGVSNAKNKKAWPLVVAWIAFVITLLFFLALGPGSIILAAMTSPYAWIVSFWWIPLVYAILTFAAPIVLILIGISIFFTYKKFPNKMRTVLILASGTIVGLPVTWLSLNGIIPMNIIIYAVLMGAMITIPVAVLIIFRIRDKKRSAFPVLPKSTNQNAAKVVFIFSLLIIVVELGFCVFQLINPVSNLIAAYEQEKQMEQAVSSAAESSGSKSSERLAKMVYAICYGEYNVVYQSADDTGLFECKESPEVFSVTDPHEKKHGYYEMASASFLGATYDETVAKYFPGTIYIYRNYLNTDIYTDLILLVEAGSEDEVIEKYSDAIYEYIKEINSEYTEDIRISVFYTDSLNTVKTTRDYILLSGVVGLYDWLPHGNGFDKYFFEADETEALAEIGENPDLYSAQTRDAIKFHRHISAEIDNGRTITLKQLRTILRNSFKESL